MSVLESMLGRIGVTTEGPCKFTSDRYDVTFTVSTESHDVAYAIPMTERELDALATLVRTDQETPYVEEGDDSLDEALEAALGEDSIDVDDWRERMNRPRVAVEPILACWQRLASSGDSVENAETTGDTQAGGHADDGDESRHSDGKITPGSIDSDGAPAPMHVVYLPVGMETTVAAFFAHCRKRADREADPFEILEDAAAVGSLLARIRAAGDRSESRVVVNRRHLPVASESVERTRNR